MIYDFRCKVCGAVAMDVILSIHHTDDDHPKCCYSLPMADYHTQAPYVPWEDQQLLDGGFRANHDGTVITTHNHNKEYIKRPGLRLAMDDYEKPTLASEARERADSQAAIDNITPTDTEMRQLKSDGIINEAGQLNQ